jgi:hypothetical protein
MSGVDIDYYIRMLRSLIGDKIEFDEQEDAGTTTSAGSPPPPYPTVTKWETGIKRGSANQIGNTKWKDSYPITRGKANTLL